MSKSEDTTGSSSLFPNDEYDMLAEYDMGKLLMGAEMKTDIFISKERVPDGQTLDLTIIYTPYKGILLSLPSHISLKETSANHALQQKKIHP